MLADQATVATVAYSGRLPKAPKGCSQPNQNARTLSNLDVGSELALLHHFAFKPLSDPRQERIKREFEASSRSQFSSRSAFGPSANYPGAAHWIHDRCKLQASSSIASKVSDRVATVAVPLGHLLPVHMPNAFTFASTEPAQLHQPEPVKLRVICCEEPLFSSPQYPILLYESFSTVPLNVPSTLLIEQR